MQGNDISNEVSQKLVFVFEGLVAKIPEEDEKRAAKYRRKGHWQMLSRIYAVDTMMAAHLWDIVWRSPFSFYVVSFETDDEAWYEALDRALGRANIPNSRLEVYPSVDDFARMIVYSPNILRVYHGNPSWFAKFGDRGELVGDAQVFQLQ
jgi:hypothetical protein